MYPVCLIFLANVCLVSADFKPHDLILRYLKT